jgi:hypothetical protein
MKVYIVFKKSVRTSKRTQHFTIRKINWLMLFKGIIAVYNLDLNLNLLTFCKS